MRGNYRVTAGVYGPHAVFAAITASHAFPHHLPSTKCFRASTAYAFLLAGYLLGSSIFFVICICGSESAPATKLTSLIKLLISTDLISWAAIFIYTAGSRLSPPLLNTRRVCVSTCPCSSRAFYFSSVVTTAVPSSNHLDFVRRHLSPQSCVAPVPSYSTCVYVDVSS